MACVYLLEDCNGFGYIGSTINLKHRLIQHKCKNNSAKSKYLTQPFECLILEEIEDEDNLEFAEQFYIKLYKDLYGEQLLNITIPLRTKKEYTIDNRDKIKEKHKNWYNKNRERVINRVREYGIENREKILENNKKNYIENRDKKLEEQKQYRIENREKVLEGKRQSYYKNIDYYKEYRSRRIECECGSTTTIYHKQRHLKSKKHQDFLNSQSS